MYTALTIAGSDSSGGAGIQADIKTMTANRVYAMSAITALTAQNTTGVTDIMEVTPKFLAEQLDSIFTDIYPDAIKTGMVSSSELIETIAEKLTEYHAKNIVVDPVMVATSGARLISEDAISVLKSKLLPLATVITPNIPEAEVLSEMEIKSEADMEKAAELICEKFDCAVLLKGGHQLNDANDLLFQKGKAPVWFHGKRIDNSNTHGTGCTLSSAIASNLAKGRDLETSVKYAKNYISGALAAMLDLENASSNDQSFTHSDLRRVARSIPQFIPGTDYICSGYSSTPNYDNMFAGSNWDADDYDDWCVIQRDLRVDAGLLPAREEEVVAARNKAAKAIQALFRELGLPEITDEEVEAATYARGSQDMPDRDVVADLKAATDMLDRGVTGIDFVKALYKGGFEDVAESIFNIQKAKVVGDYLHTASMLDDKFHVISAVNSPNCYEGPMTGYQISPELWEKISDIRTAVDPAKL